MYSYVVASDVIVDSTLLSGYGLPYVRIFSSLVPLVCVCLYAALFFCGHVCRLLLSAYGFLPHCISLPV